ncbi:MAG: hypothetical protein KIT09_31885 [Bryobacteraceae bacterium]|nr:hypothetical protein [Bryobacteraceae bacterium]
MPNPIPIRAIYQPLNLVVTMGEKKVKYELTQLLYDKSTIIFAGPGRGKTTLLHWAYNYLLETATYLPVLFTLRWPDGVEVLCDFVRNLALGRSAGRAKSLILLVDGYDEINEKERQRISRALLEFNSLGVGSFFLTCRSYYDVYDLKVRHAELSAFAHEDAIRFVIAYAGALGISISAEHLLSELHDHGFEDFASHPLMLALVCILQTGTEREIPRRSIGLIERAIQTLTLRWDQSKGVRRQSDLEIDGYERVRCLMRVAFSMERLQASWDVVESSIRRHLELVQIKGIDVRLLLTEIAQWYGVLVPTGDEWQFTHRTIHDYLAAKFWVDSGGFGSEEVSSWSTRAAYAACLLPDATKQLVHMLAYGQATPFFRECLYNRAAFDVQEVSNAVLKRQRTGGKVVFVERDGAIRVSIEDDFFGLCTHDFLRGLIMAADKQRDKAGQAVGLYALGELVRRNQRMGAASLSLHLLGLYLRAHDVPIELRRDGGTQTYLMRDAIAQ